jgi:hypothetical protein
MAISRQQFILENKNIPAPIEFGDLRIKATFDNGAAQANVETMQFTFVNEAAQQIRDHINNGLTGGVGIFEGPEYKIQVSDPTAVFTAFEGQLDLTDEFEEISPVKVLAKAKKANGLNSLSDQLSGLTYGYLESIGRVSSSDYTDVNFVVEKEDDFLEILITSITLYLMVKELAEGVSRIAERIANIAALIGSGGLTGPIGAIIYQIAILIIEIAYAATMIIAIINLVEDIFDKLLPFVRVHKGITLRRLLEIPLNHLGYGFDTGISQLDTYVYLPSKTGDKDEIKDGIPHARDFGYNVSEIFGLINDMFNAKIAVVNNVVHVRDLLDPWWIKTSTFKLDTRETLRIRETKKYNTDDMVANRFLNFLTDISDEWTIENFTGTNVSVNTSPITINNQRFVNVSGFDESGFPVALGNRKNQLSLLEEALLVLAKSVDAVLSFFGSNKKFADKIKNRVGMLKVSQKTHNIPKILLIEGGNIPANHRDRLSARFLYETFHVEKSFVANNFYGQKRIWEGQRIGLTFTDFLELVENSYFTTQTGQVGKFESVDWEQDTDTAIVDFWIRDPYTKNLTETLTEG